MTTLYYSPGACSLADHIALTESSTDHELVKVDLKEKRTETGDDYRSINPKGQVPALRLDSGDVLTENAVLLQYIADQTPRSGLLPATGIARYHALEWVNFITTEVHKGFGPLFNPATPADYRPLVMANLAQKFAYLDARLKDHPYLTGDTFTIADCYAYVMGRWAMGMKIDLSACPNFTAYCQRIGERPAVKQALAAEGLG